MTKTYIVTPEQAKEALRLARQAASDNVHFTRDPDGTELSTVGDDYLMPNGTPDVAGAIADIQDPVGDLGLEDVATTSHVLAPAEELEFLDLLTARGLRD